MALIYIVEDDEPIRRELADILARAGFEVEACESFEHVSRDILAAAPDLVLLDLTLPVKDGKTPDIMILHQLRRFQHGCVRGHGDDVLGHPLTNQHGNLLARQSESYKG